MPRLSRRSFVAWIGAVSGWLVVRSRPAQSAATDRASTALDETVAPVLDVAILSRLGDVVLPSEIGSDGVARIARAFRSWIGEYRPGVELVHPYGSSTLRFTGDSPVSRWSQQLAALQRGSREKHGKSFVALPREQRLELVRSALATERLDRMPDPLSANHVAVALASFYFGSPEATDLCYRARIGQNQCRPLVNASREPLPLVPATRGSA